MLVHVLHGPCVCHVFFHAFVHAFVHVFVHAFVHAFMHVFVHDMCIRTFAQMLTSVEIIF